MLEKSGSQRHIVVHKAGLECSLRELVKSELATLLASEREGQAGECNKTFCFSLYRTLSPSFCLNIPIFFSLLLSTPSYSQPYTFLSIHLSPTLPLYPVFTLSPSPSVWMWWFHRILRGPAFELGRNRKQRDETCRFLCTPAHPACWGRGGNCLLLSCQWCPGKTLSVHRATLLPRPKCKIRTQMPPLFLSQHRHWIHAKRQTSRPTHAFTDACTYTTHTHKHTHPKSESLGYRIIWMRPLNITSDSEHWIVLLLDVLNIKADSTKYSCSRKPCFHRQGDWETNW